jgi:predicted ribosome quality control (RQC) complex YloA/Tae2 family protein
VTELATHGANLILIDPRGHVTGMARRSRSARRRISVGHRYQPPTIPSRLLDPFDAPEERIDDLIRLAEAGGENPLDALRRGIFGIGTEGSRLVLDESEECGRSAGQVLKTRLDALAQGAASPVVLSPGDPLGAASAGKIDPSEIRLLPWEPLSIPAGLERFSKEDPAATAALYHESVESALGIAERRRALESLLTRELERVMAAERNVRADLAGFADPERHRVWGEALLAGMARARGVGERFFVPDPYDPAGAEIAVPRRPGQSPQEAADEQFRRHRRARRGLEQARLRAARLRERGDRLQAVLERAAEEDLLPDRIESAMREQGIPVALEPPTRAGRAEAAAGRPRLEGVRMFTSSDGREVLVGRSGRDNHRLTFKLATAEDFWFHARGCPGAHVIVRNPERSSRPPEATLREAAALAAWYSEAQGEDFADVQWTRRKYVRRPRGAAPGTVVLKRFETIRVRPRLIAAS